MALPKNHILVPIDFSAQSQIALEQAFNLANATRASITILYVIEHSIMDAIFSSKSEALKYRKNIQKQLDKIVSGAQKSLSSPMDTMIGEGKVYDQVVDVAKKIRAKFIIMGKSDSNHFICSNTLRVVREAPCPVISIKGTVHRPFCKHIVLPLDLTKETREKVSKAIEFAKHFNSTIHVVAIRTSDDEYLVEKLNSILSQVKHYIQHEGVFATAEIIRADNIAKSVINYSKKVKADLIMMMTQQEMDFTEYFIGSSAQQLINNSDIPVLSIRPSGKEYGYSYSQTALYS